MGRGLVVVGSFVSVLVRGVFVIVHLRIVGDVLGAREVVI